MFVFAIYNFLLFLLEIGFYLGFKEEICVKINIEEENTCCTCLFQLSYVK